MKSWKKYVGLLLVLVLVLPVASTFAQDGIMGSGLVTGPMDGEATTLNAAGATFPKPIYDQWMAEYAALTGVQINYQGIGSGGGQRGISDMSLDFAGSDAYMKDEQLAEAQGGPILHIPMVLGGVVATYNLPELAGSDEVLKFTPETLALAFLGELGAPDDREPLVKWNDPRLVADNPQLADVDKYIVIVHRSDSSGTTNIFTDYLTTISEDWASEVGAGKTVNWPTGIGAKGNPGVAGNVAQTAYALGYVEAGYAVANDLPAAAVQNMDGNFVEVTQASVSAAAGGLELPDDMRVGAVNAAGPDSYPIAGFTWILVYENQTDAAKGTAIARYLWWATHDAQEWTAASMDPVILGYAPLPPAAIEKAEALIMMIKNPDGSPALPQEIIDAMQ